MGVDLEILPERVGLLRIDFVREALNDEVLGKLKQGIHGHLKQLLVMKKAKADRLKEFSPLGLV
jgi:hypothetical protein